MIDAHLQLQSCLSKIPARELISELRVLGVLHLSVNGTSPEDWGLVSELAEDFPEVIPSFGVHPWHVQGLKPGWSEVLTGYLEKHPEAGVGEIGLDKWIRNHDIALQKEVFLEQLQTAEALGRSVTVHCLQAWGSLQKSIVESRYRGAFLLHSYSGPREMIGEWVKLGAFFSISGYFFRAEKAHKLRVFEEVPEDRILLETDAPDMSLPDERVRYRAEGMQNHPANLEVVYDLYGQWSGLAAGEVRSRMQSNFGRFRTLRSIRHEPLAKE
ncbi:MAG: TatD family hydrolase [Verrucomicrobiota bacterium]